MLHAQQQYQKPQAIIPRLLLPSESEASNYWFSLLSLSVAPDAANLFLLCDVFSCTNEAMLACDIDGANVYLSAALHRVVRVREFGLMAARQTDRMAWREKRDVASPLPKVVP